MKNWMQRSLKNQLVVLILISTVVPVFFLGIVSYISTVKVSKERAEISALSSLGQLQTSLNFIVEDVSGMSVFLIGSRDVQDYMGGEGSTPRQKSNIYGFLANLAYSKEYISNITLYPASENPVISTNVKEVEKRNFADKEENKWWAYRQYERTTQGVHETITFTRPVRSLSGFREIGYLSISINQAYVEELLGSVDLKWSGSVLLMSDHYILASSNQVEFDRENMRSLVASFNQNNDVQSMTGMINKEKSTLFSTKIEGVDWSLVGIIPYKEYSAQNRYLLSLTVITIIIAVSFVILLTLFLVSRVLNPLLLLKRSLKNTEPGEVIEQYPRTSQNEIGELIESYNALSERISFLMERVKEGESVKREVDLQALQNQINPHFLYNTLASIHWIALSSGSNNISEMVSSLGKYLRYSLNKGDEYCTVGQEIEHLLHYTNIQKIRFPNSFIVERDIPEAVKHFTMIKLLLQPLIENSILHGKHPGMNALIKIKVTVKQLDDRLYFAIIDDGVGMSQDTMQDLNEKFTRDMTDQVVIGKNYGLRNVNLRLIMHYDKQAALQLSNSDGSGVTIRFSIPLKEEW